jgi:hypothetical protein
MVEYREAGWYVAICNNARFDGHYVKVFEYPKEWQEQFLNGYRGCEKVPAASWYFLNVVDGVACVEAVYPIEIFLQQDLTTYICEKDLLRQKKEWLDSHR